MRLFRRRGAFLGKFRDADGRLEQLGLLHPDRVKVEKVAGSPRYIVTDPGDGPRDRARRR